MNFCRKRIAAILPIALLALINARSAWAHSHVFIEAAFVLDFAEGKATQIRVSWAFDEIFSDQLRNNFDKNGDGAFDGEESVAMAEVVLPNLAEFHYFTFLWLDGQPLPAIRPEQFAARLESGMATIDFTLPLPIPTDLTRHRFKLIAADRTYFVEVAFMPGETVRFADNGNLSCHVDIKPSPEDAYYEGYVVPDAAYVSCHG